MALRQFATGGVFALAMLLTACSAKPNPAEPQTAGAQMAQKPSPPSGTTPPADPTDVVANCEAKGGTIRPVGISGSRACVIPYKDAGKDCTDSADCEGECWANSGDTRPGSDGMVHGQCQPDNMHLGCHTKVTDGKASGSICGD
jgi:hypothetical protein